MDDEIKADFQMLSNQIYKINLCNTFFKLPESDLIEKEMDVEYEILNVTTQDDVYIGIINLYVGAKAYLIEDESQYIHIKICINGGFYASNKIEEKDFRKMLSLNGCSTLYSIARAQIISLSSQSMDGGQLILPMINFFKMRNKKSAENDEKRV